jgi:hypothetical protein
VKGGAVGQPLAGAIRQLPVGRHVQVIEGSRLSEAVFGLRSLRTPHHPHCNSSWFQEALRWSHTTGQLVTALCSAPAGVPEFLLDRIDSPADWCDELCSLLSVAHDDIKHDLQRAFQHRLPPAVEARFGDTREGLATVIAELDAYVSAILDPAWLRVSMALSTEVNNIRQFIGVSLGTNRTLPSTTIVPTAFGGRVETFCGPNRDLMSVPIADPGPVLNRNHLPRAPLASLIGHARTTILYALDGERTIRGLMHETGLRRDSIIHSLELLCATGLVAAQDMCNGRPASYRRTRFAEALLDTGSFGPANRVAIIGVAPWIT